MNVVVRAVADAGAAAYVHFGLRDADSSRDTLFHRFGPTDDGYRPKPAFDTYRALVAELAS